MARQRGYVDTNYLDLSKHHLQKDKERAHALLNLAPGASVLEVGCGPATDTLDLAERVGPSGRVVGVDIDPDMIAEANDRARAANLLDRVTHQVADATALPFSDATFDAVRSERVLQHIPDASAAFGEMVRVTKPGGRLVVMDTDWGSLSIDTTETAVERKLVRLKRDSAINGYIGRELFRMFRTSGLVDIEVEPRVTPLHDLKLLRMAFQLDEHEAEAVETGVLMAEDVERWRASLEAADAVGGIYGSVVMILIGGTKA